MHAVGTNPIEQTERGGVHVIEPGLHRAHCPSPIRRASPAAVVDAGPVPIAASPLGARHYSRIGVWRTEGGLHTSMGRYGSVFRKAIRLRACTFT